MHSQILTLNHEAKVKLQRELYQSLSSIEVRPSFPPDLPKRKKSVPIISSQKLSDSFPETLVDVSFDTNDCKY